TVVGKRNPELTADQVPPPSTLLNRPAKAGLAKRAAGEPEARSVWMRGAGSPLLADVQLPPASSVRKIPPLAGAAHRRDGVPGTIARAWMESFVSPELIARQFAPPSIDLKTPSPTISKPVAA